MDKIYQNQNKIKRKNTSPDGVQQRWAFYMWCMKRLPSGSLSRDLTQKLTGLYESFWRLRVHAVNNAMKCLRKAQQLKNNIEFSKLKNYFTWWLLHLLHRPLDITIMLLGFPFIEIKGGFVIDNTPSGGFIGNVEIFKAVFGGYSWTTSYAPFY